MKWNNTPVWIKVLLFVGMALMVFWLLSVLNEKIKTKHVALKQKLHMTQLELKSLFVEKQKIERLIAKMNCYVKRTLQAVRFFLVVMFIVFVLGLVQWNGMDFFTAATTAGAFAGTAYVLISWLLNSKIKNLRDLEHEVSKMIERFYCGKTELVPSKLISVTDEITILETRVQKIQSELKE